MPKSLSILYVSSEVEPFAKTGGLADVAGTYPQVIKEMGHDIRVMMPKYGFIGDRKFNIYDVIRLRNIPITIGSFKESANIRSSFIANQRTKVQVYFFDLQKYFGRKGIYVDPNSKKEYKDNDQRFISFCRGALETLKRLGWKPDIIHCNDWQSALIPVYLKKIYSTDSFYSKINTVYTIHNMAYQGIFPKSSFEKTGLPAEVLTDKGILHGDTINFMKAGIQYADVITTVSKRYAEEILSLDEYACGLKPYLRKRKKDFHGILNGVNYTIWNPGNDPLIPHQYNNKSISKKIENKKELLKVFRLPFNDKIPLIGMISRLTDQKGFDLLKEVISELMKKDLQIVILGTGEKKYHTLLSGWASKYKNKIGVKLTFDDSLAHLIEAGSDIYLMPSKYEPCGLNQIYSLRYGTIPIVHATGGLDDTVVEFNPSTGKGSGFKFSSYEGKPLLTAVDKALKIFKNKKQWEKIIQNAMSQDFSWSKSAKSYASIYKRIMK